jgi:amino acid permease
MQPLAPIVAEHKGFVIICVFMLIVFLMSVYANFTGDEEWNLYKVFMLLMIPVGIAYMVSYEWTDQSTKYYKNTQVTGTLVGFVAEGSRERSGKSYVDRHYTYVEYEIGNDRVLFQSCGGCTYPKVAVLYKN